MDTKARVLDIAMNLTRIGNWAADDFVGKRKRIDMFLEETSASVAVLSEVSLSPAFVKTFEKFLKEYEKLTQEGKSGPKDHLAWAEAMMTWGTILTHRAKFLK